MVDNIQWWPLLISSFSEHVCCPSCQELASNFHNLVSGLALVASVTNRMGQEWCSIASEAAESLQSCPTLCDPIDGSPPGSPVPGILQARTLEWVAIAFPNAWKEKWKWSRLWAHVIRSFISSLLIFWDTSSQNQSALLEEVQDT